jgi:hypothetical protein
MAMVQVGEIVRRPGKLETEILIEPFGQSKVARRDEGLGLDGCPAARVSNPGCFHRKQASTYHELVNKKGTSPGLSVRAAAWSHSICVYIA